MSSDGQSSSKNLLSVIRANFWGCPMHCGLVVTGAQTTAEIEL